MSDQQAYGPVIAKMMARAKTLATLPLGMEEKAHLLSSWVALVVYLTAHAYEPARKVLAHLNLVQRIALNLSSWHLTMGILSMPKKGGGFGPCITGIIYFVGSLPFVCDCGLSATGLPRVLGRSV